MDYQSIVVHVDQSPHAPGRIALAAALARAHGAHLVGAALCASGALVPPTVRPPAQASAPPPAQAPGQGTAPLPAQSTARLPAQPPALAPHCADARYEEMQQTAQQATQQALDAFTAQVAALGVSCEPRVLADGAALALLTRFCDLLVVTQDAHAEALPARLLPLPEYVALHAVSPVLVVPVTQARQAAPAALLGPRAATGAFGTPGTPGAPGTRGAPSTGSPAAPLSAPGQHILVAWDGSGAAASAVHAALPLLERAGRVTLAAFHAPFDDQGASLEDQRAMVAYLARHGVHAVLQVRAHGVDAGHAILELAAESGSDLVVMGCYGHARMRELLLGGASRTMLRAASVPVLMAR